MAEPNPDRLRALAEALLDRALDQSEHSGRSAALADSLVALARRIDDGYEPALDWRAHARTALRRQPSQR